MDKKWPNVHCACGGVIHWTEYPDRWEGSCYGQCASYPIKHKAPECSTGIGSESQE